MAVEVAMTSRRLTEKIFMQTVLDVCRIHGYAAFHTYDSRRTQAGFPDLEIIGHGRIFHRELKLDHGHTTPEQDACIDLINRNGGDAKVWRPAMWPEIISDLRAA